MKIYLLEQNENNDYDSYDSVVVCAENEADAKKISPVGESRWPTKAWANDESYITCTELGTANKNQKRGLILASYNPG